MTAAMQPGTNATTAMATQRRKLLCERRSAREALEVLGYFRCEDHPHGCVLGTVELVRIPCFDGTLPPAPERDFGNFTAGRFGFVLEDPRPLAEPIPARGSLGLWEWRNLLSATHRGEERYTKEVSPQDRDDYDASHVVVTLDRPRPDYQ